MSRIDITIRNKTTNELVVNKEFCRTPALEAYCENASDKKLQQFDCEVRMGEELVKENIYDFLNLIQYVMNYLKAIAPEDRKNYFEQYRETTYIQFIEDLKNSKSYLETFIATNNINKYSINII